MSKAIQILKKTSVIKTIYFNFKHLPFKQALKFPVVVSKNFILTDTSGEIVIPENFTPGKIKLGFGDVGIFDRKRSKGIWQVEGKVIFKGSANFGQGTKISISKGATLEIGDNFHITAETQILSQHKITIGKDCLISWDCLIMDTDFHHIYDKNKNIINAPKEIIVGDKVWIGCRNTILKGAVIPKNSIIGANSLVASKLPEENAIYTGNPAKKIKENYEWTI